MPRNWEQSKEATPPPPRISSKIHTNVERRRLRYPGRMASKSRSRRSSSRSRRSRSPRHKKSLTPPSKRRVPTPEKRVATRNNREDSRPTQKRARLSPRNRSKTPPPRRMSREQPRSYSLTKEATSDKTRASQIISSTKREDGSERYHSGNKYAVDSSLFRGPEKEALHDRDNLKKIVGNMRDIGTGNVTMKRSLVTQDDMSVVRRSVTARGSRDYREMDNGRVSRSMKYDLSPPLWTPRSYPYGRTVNNEESARYSSDGSRPIFDRDEGMNHRRKFEPDERDRRRAVASTSIHSDRRHCEPNSSSESSRPRESYYEEDRARVRDYPTLKPLPRDYDSRGYDKQRDERSRDELRYPPLTGRARSRSYDRSRDYVPDRKDRYDDREGHRYFRRSLERVRPEERLVKRHPSPADPRRHYVDYRMMSERRERSLERRDLEPTHYRDHEFTSSDRYSGGEYLPKSQAYYENDERDNPLASPRGRGRSLSFRGRGLPSNRSYGRPSDVVVDPVSSVRPVRASFVPREPGNGRRLSYPPRKSFRGSLDGRR